MVATRAEAHALYAQLLRAAEASNTVPATMAALGRADLFYLLVYLLRREDVDRDWLYDRCREVLASPNGHLDLWAREHYKSTIITFGLTIQNILCDPEITIGIFSHTRPIAKSFLRQIKQEFERNKLLKELYPEILWLEPKKESPKWSEDDGIVVRRRGNPKEATVEAWGLVDGQPTGRHYRLSIYDDVVTRESVTTPEMIQKTTEAWELSLNLGSEGGAHRYVGTRYHIGDTYRAMLDRGAVSPRIYPATVDGSMEGDPVLLTRESLAEKRRNMGPYTFCCQMLQDPVADRAQGFRAEWMAYWPCKSWAGMNLYLLVDPASAKKKNSDYTAMWVVGLGQDRNYYVIDGVRDRLNLAERARKVLSLHRRYLPLRVGYERYGMMSDVEYLRELMGRQNYHFDLVEVGGQMPKPDRIRRLIPLFEAGRVRFPARLLTLNSEGQQQDLTQEFFQDEFLAFPVGLHDDMLDCLARIVDADLEAWFPQPSPAGDTLDRRGDEADYDPLLWGMR